MSTDDLWSLRTFYLGCALLGALVLIYQLQIYEWKKNEERREMAAIADRRRIRNEEMSKRLQAVFEHIVGGLGARDQMGLRIARSDGLPLGEPGYALVTTARELVKVDDGYVHVKVEYCDLVDSWIIRVDKTADMVIEDAGAGTR